MDDTARHDFGLALPRSRDELKVSAGVFDGSLLRFSEVHAVPFD
jgi:hypothetical protein